LGTQLNFSTSYHLETDGKNERTNKILEYILRMYVMDQQKMMGIIFTIGRIFVKLQVLEVDKDDTFQVSIETTMSDTFELGSTRG
jgi:hypothetical protein